MGVEPTTHALRMRCSTNWTRLALSNFLGVVFNYNNYKLFVNSFIKEFFIDIIKYRYKILYILV